MITGIGAMIVAVLLIVACLAVLVGIGEAKIKRECGGHNVTAEGGGEEVQRNVTAEGGRVVRPGAGRVQR